MKKKLAAASLVALLAIGGCSTQSEAVAPDVEAAGAGASATPTPKPTDRSERGNLIKEFGQGAGMTNADGDQIVSFSINSIAPAVCTGEWATPPENGHLFVLDVAVETLPKLAESPMPIFNLSPHSMKIVAPNGTTSNANLGTAATYGCFPESEMLPTSIGPAEKATGKIVIDSEVPSGTLIVNDSFSGLMGWEYTF